MVIVMMEPDKIAAEFKRLEAEHRASDCTCRCQYRVTMAMPEDYPYRGNRWMLMCECCDRHECPVHHSQG